MRTVLLVVVVLFGTWVALIGALLLAGRGDMARRAALFLPNLILLFRGLLGDPRVPRSSRALLLFGIAWFASPIDLIPEFIPVVGPLDDVIVAVLILRHVARKAGREVLADHWRGDSATLETVLRVARI